MAETIRKQDSQYHFVNKLIKKHGFRAWNKAVIYTSPASNQRGNHGDPDSLVFLPLIKPDSNSVYSFIAAVAGPDSIRLRLFRGDKYFMYGKNFDLDTLSSELVALQCMYLEFLSIPKHDTFRINDLGIFKAPGMMAANASRFIVIDTNSGGHRNGNSNRNSVIIAPADYSCVEISLIEYQNLFGGYPPNWEPDLEEGMGYCIDYSLWVSLVSAEAVVTVPQSEGGGGGGGWWSEGDGDCRTMPGETCGDVFPVGWTPVGVDDYGFLENYLGQGFHHFETWDISPEDYAKIQNWNLNNNIDTTGLDSCIRKIIERLLNLSGDNLMGKLLTKMERSNFFANNIEKFQIKFMVKNFGADTLGVTTPGHYNTSTQIFTDTIYLDQGVADSASELGVARTLAHELIHAYIRSITYRYFYSLSASQIATMNVDTLFNGFIDTLVARNTQAGINSWLIGNPQFDHNFMADKVLNQFADAIEQIDGSRISNKRYYWYLGWGGLWQSKTFQYHWPNYPVWPPSNPSPSEDSLRGLKYALTTSRIDSIRYSIYNEYTDTTNALGRKRVPGGCYQ